MTLRNTDSQRRKPEGKQRGANPRRGRRLGQTGPRGIQAPQDILIKSVTRTYIKSLRGSLRGSGVMKALMEGRKREQQL